VPLVVKVQLMLGIVARGGQGHFAGSPQAPRATLLGTTTWVVWGRCHLHVASVVRSSVTTVGERNVRKERERLLRTGYCFAPATQAVSCPNRHWPVLREEPLVTDSLRRRDPLVLPECLEEDLSGGEGSSSSTPPGEYRG